MNLARFALIIVTCTGLMMLSAPAAHAFDRVPTMTVAELENGMTGIGKTVISGTEISEFYFEIVGILKKGGFNGGPMILVRCWGHTIDASGGIAAGYSGSPLYINGKLIGAIAAGWPFSEGDIGGVTPIHDMLKAFTYPGASKIFWEEEEFPLEGLETGLTEPIIHHGKKYENFLLLGSERQIGERDIPDDTLVMVPMKTPLIVGGLSDRYFPLLKRELEKRMPYITVLQGPGSGQVPTNMSVTDLEPGAAIGVAIITGDIDLIAIGTLTYIDNQGRILAFGHPFFMTGYMEMPLMTAEIIHTLPSLATSTKIGQALEIVGRIEQDRGTCVAGIIGEMPDMLDIEITVYDEDLDWKNTYNCQIIRDEELMSAFWSFIPIQSITQTLDRMGGGEMVVSFDVDVEGFDEPLHMENVFYSGGMFGSYYAVSELSAIINTLTSQNVYREVRINSINMEIRVREKNTTLNIVHAKSIMPEREEDIFEDELLEGEIGEGAEPEMTPGVSSGTFLKSGKTIEFIRRDVPDRALVYLANYPLGREIIKLNAGEEVLEAVEEYIADTMDEEEDFYEVPQYYPGETVEATITIRPYRQETYEMDISLEIPEDYPPGTYDISIFSGSGWYGGYYDPFMAMLGMSGGYYGAAPDSLEEAIENVMDREPNTSLTISLAPIYTDDPYAYLREDYEDPEPIQNIYHLDGVVVGSFYLPIEIIDGNNEDTEESEYEDYEDFEDFEEDFFD